MSDVTDNDRCYREVNGAYFTRNAHDTRCVEVECRGCTLCAKPRHCQHRKSCTWHVGETEVTCGRCIGIVRRDLMWSLSLYALLPVEAQGAGVNSEAANLAGPKAHPVPWSWHRVNRARLREEWATIGDESDEDDLDAMTRTWHAMIAEDYGHDLPERMTLAGSVAYLDRNLHRIANDPAQDFPLLGREVRRCRQHVETVLHNDDKPDRGAPCPDCTSEANGVGPRLVRHYADGKADDHADMWRCPRDDTHAWDQWRYESYIEERKSSA